MAENAQFRPSIIFACHEIMDRMKIKLGNLRRRISNRIKKQEDKGNAEKSGNEKAILDVGCGTAKIPGAIGIDRVQLEGVDIVHDLNIFPWADLGDETFDEIHMNDVIEHLDDVIQVMRECHRLLKLNGKLHVRVVYWNHYNAFSDPTHKQFFTDKTFKFFTGEKRPYYTDFKFSDVKIDYIFDRNAMKKFGKNPKRLFRKAYFNCNIIQGMEVTLTK
ncbi:MAG: methyltransferase domain-containing protein [Candidatus Hodarchaeota archaeon]